MCVCVVAKVILTWNEIVRILYAYIFLFIVLSFSGLYILLVYEFDEVIRQVPSDQPRKQDSTFGR